MIRGVSLDARGFNLSQFARNRPLPRARSLPLPRKQEEDKEEKEDEDEIRLIVCGFADLCWIAHPNRVDADGRLHSSSGEVVAACGCRGYVYLELNGIES